MIVEAVYVACEQLPRLEIGAQLLTALLTERDNQLTEPVHAWLRGEDHTCCDRPLIDLRIAPFTHLVYDDIPKTMRCEQCSNSLARDAVRRLHDAS